MPRGSPPLLFFFVTPKRDVKLRRVDILGFKSFRAKTGLEIADGVTVVVGPNGCGKSNIVDAIRWAIGSQSAKDLRGRAMEDVIFAGSANHRPLGFAEVSLTLENSPSSEVPALWRDLAEIRITRRLFRTGESEYEINRQRVRLRDIHELFLGTGVGAKEAYSIVEQGRIGFIVSSRPEERRVIIEEAAGITRYKFQRRTAQRRLERTRENLHRVRDVLDEVARQVASLERQAKKAARYRELHARLTHIGTAIALRRLERAQEEARNVGAQRGERQAARDASQTRLETCEARVSEATLATTAAEQSWNEATEAHFRARSRVDLLENNVVHQRRERETLDERIARLGEALEELAAAHAEHHAEAARLEEELEARSREANERGAEAGRLREALADARRIESERVRAMEQVSKRLAQRRGDVATEAARLAQARAEQEQLDESVGALHASVEAAEQDEAVAQQALASWKGKEAEAHAVRDARDAEQRAALEAERTAREHVVAARAALASAERTLASARTQRDALDAALLRGQGYDASTRDALAAAADWPGVGRPLAELLDVSPDAESTVALALGPWLDAIVVDGADPAERLLAWAVANRSALRVISSPDRRALSTPGCESRAPVPDWVAARLEAAATPLDAAALATSERVGARDARGVRVEAPGAYEVVVGAAAPAALRIRRERDAAEVALDAAAQKHEEASAHFEAAQQALERALQARADAREALELAQAAARDASREREAAAQSTARAGRALMLARQAHERTAARRASAAAREAEAQAKLSAAELDVGAMSAEIDGLEQSAEKARTASRAAADRLTDIAAQHASAQERFRSARAARTRSLEAGEAARRQEAASDAERKELREKRLRIDTQLREDQRALAASRKQADIAERELAGKKAALDAASTRRLEREAALNSARAEARSADESLTAVIVQAERAQSEAEHAESALLEQFGLTLAAAREQIGDMVVGDELVEERARLSVRIERLGAVNPAAVEEYEEASQRHAQLDEQRDDLERAMADLETAIRRIDKTSKERFGEMFEAVRERFRVLYPRLFRGGKADLVLTSPDNLLESGVEIVAQPPGKRLQSISLMSGGEKALTAVALIFAIFQLKPTPFCILDEVDAPLDDANVSRFAEMVEEMSSSSQFLIITHNKTTMESASTLYGVTMQEPGVSNVVGVRLHGRDAGASPSV